MFAACIAFLGASVYSCGFALIVRALKSKLSFATQINLIIGLAIDPLPKRPFETSQALEFVLSSMLLNATRLTDQFEFPLRKQTTKASVATSRFWRIHRVLAILSRNKMCVSHPIAAGL